MDHMTYVVEIQEKLIRQNSLFHSVFTYRNSLKMSPPLIIPAPLKSQKKVSSTSNNSRPLTIPAYGIKQNYILFFRPTVKKFTNNCLGPFQIRENKKTNQKLVRKCLNYENELVIEEINFQYL